MTTDRMALANVLRDNGIGDQRKAENVATAIFDAIKDNVATKTDIAELSAATKMDFASVRADITALTVKVDLTATKADVALIEHRLLRNLIAAMVVLFGAAVTVLRVWHP